jgi:hypothetical protein
MDELVTAGYKEVKGAAAAGKAYNLIYHRFHENKSK